MTLAPLIAAPLAIQLHAGAAMSAFVLGLVQFALPKGRTHHRIAGWTWAVLMAFVAASAFWIHEIRLWGPWSPIHLISIFVLVTLPLAVYAARRHDLLRHRTAMIRIYVGGLVVAGLFTFLPMRIMGHVLFG